MEFVTATMNIKQMFAHGALYAITPPLSAHASHDDKLIAMCQQALSGGVSVIQYRDKTATVEVQARRAAALANLCRDYAALFIVNDSPILARQCAANGVHIGREDGGVRAAKTCMENGIVGVSCQNNIGRAVQAARDGADYAAFGAVFATNTKSDAAHCPLSIIGKAKAQCDLPIVAVGGITLQNISAVRDAGADAAAVCKGLFDAPDIPATARLLCQTMRS